MLPLYPSRLEDIFMYKSLIRSTVRGLSLLDLYAAIVLVLYRKDGWLLSLISRLRATCTHYSQ